MDEMKMGREKFWSEVDSSEKCKRLRIELKRCQREVIELRAMVMNLMKHEHVSDGTAMVPLERDITDKWVGRSLNPNNPDEVYF